MALAPHLWMIFVGRMLSGASSATFSVASAYLADRSSEESRTKSFGIVGAAGGIGFVMGPFLGGLLGTLGPRAPFFAASVLTFVALLGTLIVVRESRLPKNRRPISWHIVNPLSPLMRPVAGTSALLFAVYFLEALAGFVFPAVWAYFGVARFGWDSTMIGVSFGIMGVCFALSQAIVLGRLTSWMGNLNAARVAIFSGAIGFLALVWLQSGWVAMALLPVFALRGIAGTAIIGESSVHVNRAHQGELQGAFASIMALASMVAYPVMTQLFAVQLAGAQDDSWHSGSPFLLAASLSALALALLILGRLKRQNLSGFVGEPTEVARG
jgi:DHA1 family tetracycline resistance protein-like MFS transporter